MKTLDLPKGIPVLIGAPAKPMPQAQSFAIGEIVRGMEDVREAYLPHCFVHGVMENPAEILVVVLDAAANRQRVLEFIGEELARVLPPGTHLDVWPMNEGDSLLSSVRDTRTHIHCPPPPAKKPWWRIF